GDPRSSRCVWRIVPALPRGTPPTVGRGSFGGKPLIQASRHCRCEYRGPHPAHRRCRSPSGTPTPPDDAHEGSMSQTQTTSDPAGVLHRSLGMPDSAVSILLTTVRINTWHGSQSLTSASGFFFRRDARLFLVTNRHVFADVPSGHFPDRIEIGL